MLLRCARSLVCVVGLPLGRRGVYRGPGGPQAPSMEGEQLCWLCLEAQDFLRVYGEGLCWRPLASR